MTTRRIVTGHAPDGRSVVIEDGVVPYVRSVPGATFDEVWATGAAPEPLSLKPVVEPTRPDPAIAPPAGGSTIRIIDFDPGMVSPMHRTRTIDYGIVLTGEMAMILSDDEILVRAGDVVVQRGTDHAWANRSAEPARMAFVLIDASFDTDLTPLIDGQAVTL